MVGPMGSNSRRIARRWVFFSFFHNLQTTIELLLIKIGLTSKILLQCVTPNSAYLGLLECIKNTHSRSVSKSSNKHLEASII
jgi:hypothetical protein